MVSFEPMSQERYVVKVDGHTFGIICEEKGFYTDAGMIRTFVRVSVEDLRTIADEVVRVKATARARKVQLV